ncbi:MAG: SDR family oxidoreductase [Peptococcaceae bacterium]|nr:SDR family oxidoreductase [Peptococcaceae bacterium]
MVNLPKPQGVKDLRSVYDMLSLKGKSALITGAAGGIGRSTAAAMAELGAKVMLMDIPSTEDHLKKITGDIKERYGAETAYVVGDVRDPDSIQGFVDKTVETFGTIDILHNNAGIGGDADGWDVSYDLWNKIVAINLTGPLLVAQAAARVMIAHKHGGSIVTTSSMSGLVINAGTGYSATKAGVRHLTNSLAMSLAKYGIRCNSVCYGFILSGMHENMNAPDEQVLGMYKMFEENTPIGFMGELSDAVGCVVFLASDLARFATGSTVVVDGGYTTK